MAACRAIPVLHTTKGAVTAPLGSRTSWEGGWGGGGARTHSELRVLRRQSLWDVRRLDGEEAAVVGRVLV